MFLLSILFQPLRKYFIFKMTLNLDRYYSISKFNREKKHLLAQNWSFMHKSNFLYNQPMSLSFSPLAPIAFYILAHPVAKYLFIKVCPKFAISHFGCHHVKLKKASVDIRSHSSQIDHSIPLQSYGRVKDNCEKLWIHDNKQARIYKCILQVKQIYTKPTLHHCRKIFTMDKMK